MISKKIIIISISVIVVAAIVITIFLFRTPAKESSSTSQVPSASSAVSPILPYSVSAPARDQSIKINNPNPANEIKKYFNGFVGESIETKAVALGVKTIKFTDASGKFIAIPFISKAIGIAVPQQLQDLIDDKYYDIFYCPASNGKKDFGLILYARSVSGRALGPADYQSISDQMKQWESSILADLHTILFPDINFSNADLNQPLKFQDGKARYAELHLPNGTKSFIEYKQLGDPIIITSSLECLDKANGYFFDTEEK